MQGRDVVVSPVLKLVNSLQKVPFSHSDLADTANGLHQTDLHWRWKSLEKHQQYDVH